MAGRLAWILAGGAAIVGGMALQDGDLLTFGDDRAIDRAVDASVDDAQADARRDTAIDREGRVQIVVGGQRSSVDAETVETLTEAVGDLVKAETALAIAESGSDAEAIASAKGRRDKARALVDDLKVEVEAQGEAAARVEGGAATRDQIREEVRDEVRAAVRNN